MAVYDVSREYYLMAHAVWNHEGLSTHIHKNGSATGIVDKLLTSDNRKAFDVCKFTSVQIWQHVRSWKYPSVDRQVWAFVINIKCESPTAPTWQLSTTYHICMASSLKFYQQHAMLNIDNFWLKAHAKVGESRLIFWENSAIKIFFWQSAQQSLNSY